MKARAQKRIGKQTRWTPTSGRRQTASGGRGPPSTSGTSIIEVSNISAHGFWLFVVDREYFLPFAEYPWFRKAPVAQILNVRLLHGHHLQWPDLEVDLELESLGKPEKYPLTYR